MKRATKIKDFAKCEIISLDFETISLTDLSGICFSMASRVGSDLIAGVFRLASSATGKVVFNTELMAELIEFIKGRRIVFHNMKFDGKVLVKGGMTVDDWGKVNYEDTILMARLLSDEWQVGLKPRALEDLGMVMAEYSPDLATAYLNETSVAEFEKYAADDAVATYLLFEIYRERIRAEKLIIAYMIEKKAVLPVMYMELNGIGFDEQKCEDLKILASQKVEEYEDQIYMAAGRQINVNASKDVAAFLFDELGIQYKDEYSKGLKNPESRSVKAEVMEDIKNNLAGDYRLDIVNALIEIKKLRKLLSSFFDGQKVASRIYGDGRVHSSFNQVAVITGRYSSSDPNLQQLPSGSIDPKDPSTGIRAMYVPKKGHKFIDVDFSQIELRLLAHFSEDPVMIKGFFDGEDFHQKTVDMTGGFISRREAKIANFGMLYGMSFYGFAHQAKITPDAARKYYHTYDKVYPAVPQMKMRIKETVAVNKYVRMLGGRKRRMETELDEGTIERVYVNSLIQGSAAVILKMAMIGCFDKYKNDKCKMVLQVHDEIVFEVPEKHADKYAKEIQEIMENCVKLRVPLVAEPKIINNFGEAKE